MKIKQFRACDRCISLESGALVMGVVNVTPDSFSDGGRYLDPAKAVDHIDSLIEQGADIVDIGGESTRPGAPHVNEQEELRRLKPVLEAIGHRCSVPISIDTQKASIAKMALDLGAIIVNDISALQYDPDMARVVAESRAGLVLMHMQGSPETMQQTPVYADVVGEVKTFLKDRVAFASQQGIAAECMVVDPGIGFGKTLSHNLKLIKQCGEFVELDRPVMVGVSNKSFLGKILDKPSEERTFGSAAATAIAIFQGAQIIRVHEVNVMRDVMKVAVSLRESPM